MKTENVEQFLDMCRELRRQGMGEEHARDMEILEATEKLLVLIPSQISSLQDRLQVLRGILRSAEWLKYFLEQKEASSELEAKAEVSPASPATPGP